MMVFDWTQIRDNFQFWRLFTPFIFTGPFGLNFLMHCVVLYQNCSRYEEGPVDTGARGSSADFLFMILLSTPFFLLSAFYLQAKILGDTLLFMVMYVWSRQNPEALLNFYGFKFQGQYAPWIYIALRVVMNGSPVLPLLGVIVGHIYWFTYNKYDLFSIKTPKFCVEIVNYFSGPRVVNYVPANANATGGGAAANTYVNPNRPAAAAATPTTTGGAFHRFPGSGRRLGTD
jgi:Derlin-2/3